MTRLPCYELERRKKENEEQRQRWLFSRRRGLAPQCDTLRNTLSSLSTPITMPDLTFDNLVDDGNYLGSERARIENKVILDELERKKKARAMAVPTDDNRVKARLREIGEPITLFGERVRLILVLNLIGYTCYYFRLQTGAIV
jgi:pre-mRNA processing factor 4 (PRP4) like